MSDALQNPQHEEQHRIAKKTHHNFFLGEIALLLPFLLGTLFLGFNEITHTLLGIFVIVLFFSPLLAWFQGYNRYYFIMHLGRMLLLLGFSIFWIDIMEPLVEAKRGYSYHHESWAWFYVGIPTFLIGSITLTISYWQGGAFNRFVSMFLLFLATVLIMKIFISVLIASMSLLWAVLLLFWYVYTLFTDVQEQNTDAKYTLSFIVFALFVFIFLF